MVVRPPGFCWNVPETFLVSLTPRNLEFSFTAQNLKFSDLNSVLICHFKNEYLFRLSFPIVQTSHQPDQK